MIKPRKQRKPRGRKLDGTESFDFCPHCMKPGCDPFGGSRAFQRKFNKRRDAGLCPACGHMPCRCKSSVLSPEAHKEREMHIGKK